MSNMLLPEKFASNKKGGNSNMRKRELVFAVVMCLLCFYGTMNACPPPPCPDPDCYAWNGAWCYYVGCVPACTGCQFCEPVSCTCYDTDYLCSGCQRCSAGVCVNDNSRCNSANCEYCDGVCKSWCNPANCETCIGGVCKVCGGDANKKCCNGSCVEKCKLVDGLNCSGPGHGCLVGCAIGDSDCSWVHAIEYADTGVEKICDPRGCWGDCLDDLMPCFFKIPCVPGSVPIPFSECEEISPPGGYYTCTSTWPDASLCYYCVQDASDAELKSAQNDYCFP